MLIPFIRAKGIKLYNPIILVTIVYFMQFSVPTLYMTINPELFYGFEVFPDEINNGLTFIVLVFLFFLIGYYLPDYSIAFKKGISKLIAKFPSVNDYDIRIKNLPLIIIILFVAGWIARLFIIKSGVYIHTEATYKSKPLPGFELYSQLLGYGTMLPYIVLVLSYYNYLKNEKKIVNLLILLFLLAVEILYAIPSGMKERILFPLVILIFIYSLKKNLPLIIIVPVITFTIFFVFPFTGIYRSMILSPDLLSNVQWAINEYIKMFIHFDKSTFNLLLFSMFGERFNSAVVVVKIVENTPAIWDFKLGYTYLVFFLSLIPRIIWHSKPHFTNIINEFGRYYGFISPVDYSTSIDMTWVGEMFINLGWFGVVFAFLYGLLYRVIYNYFMARGKLTSYGAIFYVFVLYSVIRGEMFALLFSGTLKFCFVLVVIFYPFIKRVTVRK